VNIIGKFEPEGVNGAFSAKAAWRCVVEGDCRARSGPKGVT
jgi:hypothetical protein